MAQPSRISVRPELNRGEGLSAWRQIADMIEADIADGRLPPGGQLPTEAQLAGRFGVNRHTVRRALAALAARGLVRATQGRGTFVEPRPLPYPIGRRTRFSEIVSRSGREPGGRLLAARQVAADQRTGEALGLAPGAPVLEIQTLRSADGVPVSFATSYLPLPRFEGFEHYLDAGVSGAFERYGIADYRRATTRISARLCAADIAAHLELAPGRAVLVVESVNVDADAMPIQATMAFFAADRMEIVVES